VNRHERRKQRALGSDPRLRGMDLRYGGRTLEVKVYLNTEGDPHEIAERVKRAASGPKMDMAIVLVGDVDKEQAEGLWSAVFGASEQYVKREGKA
jgi:hypothetical protein